MANKLGIEHLKEPVKGIGLIWNQYHAAKADGKIELSEILGFLPPLMQIPEILKNREVMKAEFEDRDEAEIEELAAYAFGTIEGTVAEKDKAKVRAILGLIAAGLIVQLAFSAAGEDGEAGGTPQ